MAMPPRAQIPPSQQPPRRAGPPNARLFQAMHSDEGSQEPPPLEHQVSNDSTVEFEDVGFAEDT